MAYLILVHSDESVLASQRLLPAIWRPDFFYLYVVDQSTDELGRLRLDEFLGSPAAVFHGSANVRAMTTNVLSGWGTLGLVQNELDGLQELLGLGKWDYAINLSGDTYPLVGQAELAERLAHWRGANFVTDPGTRPQRANEVPELKLARLANVTWPTGVAEPDQYGSQVRLFVLGRDPHMDPQLPHNTSGLSSPASLWSTHSLLPGPAMCCWPWAAARQTLPTSRSSRSCS